MDNDLTASLQNSYNMNDLNATLLAAQNSVASITEQAKMMRAAYEQSNYIAEQLKTSSVNDSKLVDVLNNNQAQITDILEQHNQRLRQLEDDMREIKKKLSNTDAYNNILGVC